VHELRVPDAALVRLLEPFELRLEEVEPFDVHYNGRLPAGMRRFEIGSRERAAQPMVRHHLIYPGEALEMVLIEQARLWRTLRDEDAGCIPTKDGTVRHIRETRDRKRSRPQAVREIVAGGRLRRDSGRPAMCMDIDGDGFPQNVERGRSSCGRLGGGCRTTRSHTAAEHRADRSQYRTPHPISARHRVTAAVHVVALQMRGQYRLALQNMTRAPAAIVRALGSITILRSSLRRTSALGREHPHSGEDRDARGPVQCTAKRRRGGQ